MRVLLFIFLFAQSISFGQHKIGASNAFTWSNFVDQEKNIENKFLFGYSGKVYYEYGLDLGLAFNIGLCYQQRGYKFDSFYLINGTQLDFTVKYRTQQITIPIGVRYYFLKSNFMFFGVDFQPGFRFKDKRTGPEVGWGGYHPSAQSQYEPNQKFDFSIQLEFAPASFHMHIGSTATLNAYLAVYFQYSLTKMNPHQELNNRDLNLYTIGLNLIANVNFARRK